MVYNMIFNLSPEILVEILNYDTVKSISRPQIFFCAPPVRCICQFIIRVTLTEGRESEIIMEKATESEARALYSEAIQRLEFQRGIPYGSLEYFYSLEDTEESPDENT